MSRTAYYYKPKLSDDSEIIDVLNKLTDKHNRWGFSKCFKRIRKLGYQWNHKRVHRVYTALNLNLRRAKWTMPIRNWGQTMMQLSIYFPGRLDSVMRL